MFDLGKLYIPTILSFDPSSKTISFTLPEFFTKEHFEHVQYSLELNILGSDAIITEEFLEIRESKEYALLSKIGMVVGWID